MLPNQQLKKATALALALGAILPATATAMPNRSDPNDASLRMLQTPLVRITTPASGFDWGDAGIGAAGGLGLSVLALGGGLVIAQHRGHRSKSTAAATG